MLRINQLAGFYARAQRVKVNYIGGFDVGWPSGAVSTPINIDLTQEAASRYVVVCFLSEEDYITTAMTLEGESMTKEVTERESNANLTSEIWAISFPTGLSNQSLVVTKNTTINRSSRVYVFEVFYVNDVDYAFDSGQFGTFEGTQLSWNIDSSPGGLIIGCSSCVATGTTVTWTGLDELVDEAFSDGRFSVAFKADNFDAGTKVISVTKGSSLPAMTAAILSIA